MRIISCQQDSSVDRGQGILIGAKMCNLSAIPATAVSSKQITNFVWEIDSVTLRFCRSITSMWRERSGHSLYTDCDSPHWKGRGFDPHRPYQKCC
jgi:hypothetical protein